MRVRDPRYTGANRCWPCTTLNVGLVAIGVGLLVVAGALLPAGVLLVGGLGVVAVRGYLVPGTPALGRRLPPVVRSAFGKSATATAPATVASLVEHGLLTDDLDLDDEAAERLLAESRTLVEDRERLRAAVRSRFADVEEVSVNRALGGGETWLALDGDEVTRRQWEARPVAALDAAGAAVLAETGVEWTGGTSRAETELLALLRSVTPRCPRCGGRFETRTDRRVVCCGGRSLAGDRRCADCGYALVDENDLPTGEATARETPPGREGRS